MCGIAGTLGGGRDDGRAVEAALRALRHRGPDDGGRVDLGAFQAGYCRLAIRDAADGRPANQPFRAAGERWTMYANGEVFAGVDAAWPPVAEPAGDLAALLDGLVASGPAALDRLDADFTAAIWDAETQTALLARDRFGVKPLFYAEHAGRLCFASEVKGLAALGVPLRPDAVAVREYLRFNYPIAPRTLYAGVRAVPPGSALRWHRGRVTLERWAAPAADPAHDGLAPLRDAVRARLASERPLGFHLSGGVDSSLVCHLGAAPDRAGFSLVYGDAADGDLAWARAVAGELRLDHHVLDVAPDGATGTIDELIRVLDAPVMSPGALTPLFVARAAREAGVTVLVAGQGADEVFLGYRRHAEVGEGMGGAALTEIAANVDRADLRAIGLGDAEIDAADEGFRALCDHAPDVAPLAAFQVAYGRSFLQELLRIEDHCHMASSVENRVPFLAPDVVALGCGLTRRRGRDALGKPLLREHLAALGSAAARRTDKQQMALPLDVLDRWIAGALAAPDLPERLPLLDWDAVRDLAGGADTRSRRRLAWAAANLARWAVAGDHALAA
ncbi:MAG TPA: asparagine synthase-related protein [Solirubrobacteraceae bacterium]|jgi:asparagine synthase (glutamine-hydrolysing)